MQIKRKIVSKHTVVSKPVKEEVNGTVILPPLVFPAGAIDEPALTANILAAATNKNKADWQNPQSAYELNFLTKLNTQGFSYVAIAQCPL